MARLLTNTELIKRLVSIEMFLPLTTSPFDQITAGATAKNNATITVPATTNASPNDHVFIIGANGIEVNQLGTPATTMPLTWKTAFQHPAGTRLLEAVKHSLGRVEVNGFSLSPSQQESIIEAADVETVVQTTKSTLELGWSFGLLGANAQNLLNALGYQDNESAAAGTAGDPRISTVGDATASLIDMVAFRITLLRFDSMTVTLDLTNCSIAPQGQIQMGGKSAASVTPFSGKCSYIVRREWA